MRYDARGNRVNSTLPADESFLRCFDMGQVLQAAVSSLHHAKNSKAREVWVKSGGRAILSYYVDVEIRCYITTEEYALI